MPRALPTLNFQLQTLNFQLSTTNTYPLSIFPESEQRRIAADFGEPRVPVAVKRAITGAEKAMALSRKRAEKRLCTKEESEAFCEKSAAALRNYVETCPMRHTSNNAPDVRDLIASRQANVEP